MEIGKWKFEKEVADIFDRHVYQSVPMYNEIQDLITDIAQFFVRENDTIYDIGTSTGTTIYNLKHSIDKSFNAIGIDNSIDMINRAKEKLHLLDDVELICTDIKGYDFKKKSNLIVSNLTLQFVPMELREKLLGSIYNTLNIGGALIMVEKTYGASSQHQEIYTQLYHDFKEEMGLTTEEIRGKDKSLRSILTARRSSVNKTMLQKAGFEVDEFFRCLNFVGYLAIKVDNRGA